MPEEKSMMQVVYKTLSNGAKMPMIGAGFWQIAPQDCRTVVEEAIRVGYRHFDFAHVYGNEKAIGDALCPLFKSERVKRSELFITSKLWCTSFRPENVRKACDQTLKELQLDYLDLYLVHWPFAFRTDAHGQQVYESDGVTYALDNTVTMLDTWRAMEELQFSGKVRSIGVSNFTVPKIRPLLGPQVCIRPAVLQVEIHPTFSQSKLVQWCRQNGIVVTAYSPLGTGPDVNNPIIRAIADKHKCTPSQVCLKWNIDRGVVVIPKTKTVGRLAENLGSLSVRLTDGDMRELGEVDTNHRVLHPQLWWGRLECFEDDNVF